MSEAPATEALTPTGLARACGISVPYASQILSDAKTPTQALAIRIFRATGVKFSPIQDATDAEIDVLEKFSAEARKGSVPSQGADAAHHSSPAPCAEASQSAHGKVGGNVQ